MLVFRKILHTYYMDDPPICPWNSYKIGFMLVCEFWLNDHIWWTWQGLSATQENQIKIKGRIQDAVKYLIKIKERIQDPVKYLKRDYLRKLLALTIFAENRSSYWGCSVKKVFLEILQNSQENNCARASILIKLQAWNLELY